MSIKQIIVSNPDVALKTYVIAPRDYADTVLEKMVKLGVFEPIHLEEEAKKKEVEEYINLVEKCKKLFDSINSYIEEPLTIEVREIPANTRQTLESLYNKLSNVLNLLMELDKKRNEYHKKVNELSALQKYVDHMNSIHHNTDSSILDYDGALIVVKTFFGLRGSIEALKGKAMYVLGELSIDEQNAFATIAFEKSIADEVLKEVEQRNLREIEISKTYGYVSLSTLSNMIKADVEKLKVELSNIENRINDIVKNNAYDIALLKILVDVEYSKTELLKVALESKHLSLLSGWVLKSKKDSLYRELGNIPLQIVFEEDPEPPVEFNNLKPFKPFEMFTELNGHPSPREWDPTPLLTYFYAIFFALMFPDIGYAIGLLIGSKYVLPYFVQNPETLQKLRKIVYATAFCAVVTGVLSGSFLGSLIGQYISMFIPSVLPSPPPRLLDLAATVEYMKSAIKLALLVGYISILVAHLTGFAKAAIKTHDLWTAILEACMVIMIVFGPPFITYKLSFTGINIDVFKLGRVMPVNIIEYIIYATLVVYIFCKIKTSGPAGALFWIFDVIGILADNMSFVRIAGIGAGSALLTEIFNGFVYSAMQSFAAINIALGIVAGIATALMLHIFALAASVLGPYIHSLRLITYEMASKFYEGSGRRITPIRVSLGSISLGVRMTS